MNRTQNPLVQVQIVEIDAEHAGQRIDNFLIARLKGVPKSRIYRILRKGEVRANKGRIKPDYKVQTGDLIRIPPIRIAAEKPLHKPGATLVELLESAIIFETDALLVVNKPAGLAVHGGSGINLGLIEALRQMRSREPALELVHRLDRDTSGCIMVSKRRSLLRDMQAQWREGKVKKIYNALVAGHWSKRKLKINAPLKKNELSSGERIVRVDPDGKPSLTEFRVLTHYGGSDVFSACTLVEVQPVTGRTHQIRVHAQYAGHALIGDEKYGDDQRNKVMRDLGFKRLFLHAANLSFCLPGEARTVRVEAPLSNDLVEGLARLEAISLAKAERHSGY